MQYWVNGEKYAAHLALREKEYGYPSSAELRDRDDWYLSRDSRNRLTTVIKCDSHLTPDGFIIPGERVIREGNRSTGCVHYFLMPEETISFSVDYPRVFLRYWKRIEERSRSLLPPYLADCPASFCTNSLISNLDQQPLSI